MLIFQLFVYPRVVERIGATRSQRWSCCVTIPVYLSYPLLSMLHDSGEMLVAASVVVLFFTSIAANAVGATPASIQSLWRAHVPIAGLYWCTMSTIFMLLDVSTGVDNLDLTGHVDRYRSS